MYFCLFFGFLISLFSVETVDLRSYEVSLYSKHGEDGVLAALFRMIPVSQKYCVDLGAKDGMTMSNTYWLRLQGWNGLGLDRKHEKTELRLYKEFLTKENINQLFKKYHVPYEFGLLSISVAYNSFHIWNALDPKYRPSVVVIPYNSTFQQEDLVVAYHPFYCGDETDYFGASILALYKLGRKRGYSLVYVESSGNNLFFIRDDLLLTLSFINMNDPDKLYRPSTEIWPHKANVLWPLTTAEEMIR